MLLQTNSYVVPKEKRAEHARLVRRFRQTLGRLGCDQFDVFEQVGANWAGGETSGRFVQMMRFRDRKHQLSVQAAEKQDPSAQALIAEFCELINFPYQQQQGLFAVGYYQSVLPVAPVRGGGFEQEESAVEGEAIEPQQDVEADRDETEAVEVQSVDAAEGAEPTGELVEPAEPAEPSQVAGVADVADDNLSNLGEMRIADDEPLGEDIDIAEILDTPANAPNNGDDSPPQR